MSYITEVLVYDARHEDIERVNIWLDANSKGQCLNKIDMDAAGGHKWFTGQVYAAAINYAPIAELEDCLRINLLPSAMIVMDTEGDDRRQFNGARK